ncbi:MAG TPA: DMT family transporter [Noviherbaspirillum sp.]|uniref:DMT family transporter n=1 Tax=Noviherbaspirillum sp. TaxID=1926288 RepID=UPI002B46E5A2|nr:DMT family transporter [Noviherbaspirillum sp.]HJV88008.1 DMT family transporter [Noviherbaspirillum sp.]
MIGKVRHRTRHYASHWAQDGRLYAVLSACGFSLKAVFVKLAYAAGPVEPLTLLALRMAFALPLFLWLAWKSAGPDAKALTAADVARIFGLACLGYYLSSLFDFYGLRSITAGLERLILYLYPTLVLLLQAWRTRHWPHARAWQAMSICYVGLAIAFANDLHQAGQGASVLAGSAWVFASAVTYALYYVGTGEMVSRIGSMRLSGLAGTASCLLVLGHFALFGETQALMATPAGVWTNAALMAVLSTALPIYWLALAIQRLGAGNAAAVGTLGPVMTVFAAWLLLGEALSLPQLAGLALVMVGVTRLKPASASKGEAVPLNRAEAVGK